MRPVKAAVSTAAAAVLAGSLAGAPMTPAAAQADASCATRQLQQVPGGSTSVAGSVPVVFIHGIISTAQMWKPARQLRSRRELRVFGIPGQRNQRLLAYRQARSGHGEPLRDRNLAGQPGVLPDGRELRRRRSRRRRRDGERVRCQRGIAAST